MMISGGIRKHADYNELREIPEVEMKGETYRCQR